MNNTQFEPLLDRVLIEPQEEKREGRIVLPESSKEKPIRGKVLAVGTGKNKSEPLNIKVGDIVMFGKYGATPITLDEKDLLILRQEDILGIFH